MEAVGGMPIYKRKRTQVDPLADVDTNQAFPRLRLTEPQWGKISNLLGIPESMDEARKSIEIALGMFRQLKAKECHFGGDQRMERSHKCQRAD